MGYFLASAINYSFLTLFLNNIVGYPEDIIGLIFAVSAVSGAATAPLAGRLAEKYPSRFLLVTGLLADAISVILLVNTSELWRLIIIAIVWGAVATFYWPVMDATVAKCMHETCFKICSGFVLSPLRKYLHSKGFFVEKVKISGELQEKVEKSFTDWCVEVGVSRKALSKEAHEHFFAILEWVAEKIELREGL
jgi:hypothetical protein